MPTVEEIAEIIDPGVGALPRINLFRTRIEDAHRRALAVLNLFKVT